MLRELEYFASLASIHVKDYEYPKKDLDDMWENVLLYQPPFAYCSLLTVRFCLSPS
jgi:alpha-mannosidase